MEKKSNSGLLVGILIGIIIMLVVCIGLFATGTVSFKEIKTDVENGKNNEKMGDESNNELSENEAIAILKEKYDVARKVFDLGMISYCGEYVKEENSSKIINDSLYMKSATYSSFSELSEYLEKYMTKDLLNSTPNYNDSISKSYYEEGGNLYCNTRNKGSDMNYTNYLENESLFKINQITENSITATITAMYSDVSEEEKNSKTINIIMIKSADNWLINSYEDVTKN
ncbi:MAG: hypothetical protein VZS44_06400 [Bacilli bacterium]|nr:hypothetical protein [Bacilli bacterium]